MVFPRPTPRNFPRAALLVALLAGLAIAFALKLPRASQAPASAVLPEKRVTLDSSRIQAQSAVASIDSPVARELAAARAIDGPERSAAIVRALEHLGQFPADALTAGKQLLSEEPQHAAEFGTVLMGALVRAGEFPAALELASTAGPAENRSEWMSLVLDSWVRHEPNMGPELAGSLIKQGISGPVFDAFARGWADSAPDKLADFAAQLPPGPSRASAFNAAWERWVERDPMTAAQWMAVRLKDAPEFEPALATLLARTDDLFTSTETAVQWAEAIDDPALRLSATTHVLQRWARRDRAAAVNYVRTAPKLDPSEREKLLAALVPEPSEE